MSALLWIFLSWVCAREHLLPAGDLRAPFKRNPSTPKRLHTTQTLVTALKHFYVYVCGTADNPAATVATGFWPLFLKLYCDGGSKGGLDFASFGSNYFYSSAFNAFFAHSQLTVICRWAPLTLNNHKSHCRRETERKVIRQHGHQNYNKQ